MAKTAEEKAAEKAAKEAKKAAEKAAAESAVANTPKLGATTPRTYVLPAGVAKNKDEMLATIEAYRKQNPAKAALKEAEWAKKLEALPD